MLLIIGWVIVIGSIVVGFKMNGGAMSSLLHISEVIIIGGAGLGAFVASCTGHGLKAALKNMVHAFTGKAPGKAEYLELLAVLFGLFSKMNREGVISIEKDIENPESSPLFQRYPKMAKDKEACLFIGDTLRIYLTTGSAGELEQLMGADIETMHEEELHPAHGVEKMAESLPGMGIVAAVLGVVLTMSKINDGAEVLGNSIAAALVGTFVGILLCYGIMAPVGAKMEALANERTAFFKVIKEALGAAVRGSSPIVAMEYGRRAIPLAFRPSFSDMEQSLKGS